MRSLPPHQVRLRDRECFQAIALGNSASLKKRAARQIVGKTAEYEMMKGKRCARYKRVLMTVPGKE